ncbi:MAG TPA: protein kinase [Phototrophicaceae bacterium]|nr:protein kinase [Phototrophicaceae bacterium]
MQCANCGSPNPDSADICIHCGSPLRARGLEGLARVFVGRDAELERLRPLSTAVQAGLGRAVMLVGEPGLGKSRLLSEWRSGQTVRWVEGQCQAVELGFPYQLIIALLRSLLDVGEGEAGAALLEHTDRLFGASSLDVYPYLAHLLGLELSGAAAERVERLDPQALAQQYAEAFRRFLTANAAAAPLVVVCEDIHWADTSSVEVLTKLLPLIPMMRVLFCFTTRPERDVPGWRLVVVARDILGDALTEIQLKPLTDADSQHLLATLLATNTISTQVMQAVRSKAEGNPFFVEELVRALIEDGTIRRESDRWVSDKTFASSHVPDSLNGLLLARIERQPEDVQRIVRVGSVIGRQFSVRVLQAVLGDAAAALMTRLSALETASLIQLTQVDPELEYRFRHALVQEASYDSLLPDERRQLHHAVGHALETLYPERAHDLAATIGHHFMEAGENAAAKRFYLLAAEYAARMYANAEAISYYGNALLTSDPADADRFRVLRERGALHERIGAFEAARGDYEAALAAAQQQANRPGEWQALIDLGALWASLDYAQTGTYYRRAYDLARELDEPRLLASALNRLGNWHTNQEDLQVALQYEQEALRLFEEQDNQDGVLESLDLLGMTESIYGDFVAAERYSDRVLKMARERDAKPLIAQALVGQALIALSGDVSVSPQPIPFEKRIAAMEEALQIARSIGWRSNEAFLNSIFGMLLGRSGDYTQAMRHIDEATQIALEIDHQQWQIDAAVSRANILMEMGAPQMALDVVLPALELTRKVNAPYWERVLTSLLVLIDIRLGKLDQAETALNTLLDFNLPPKSLAERMLWMGRVQLELARDHFDEAMSQLNTMLSSTPGVDERGEHGILMVSLARGKALTGLMRAGRGTPADLAPKAEAAFRAAEQLADDHHLLTTLWRVKAAFGELYRFLMRSEEAEQKFSEARALVDQIAATAPSEELRAQLVRGAAEEWSITHGDLAYRVINGYQIRETISSGGFGLVYRAYQPVVDREVAIKVILPQYANQAEFIQRFDAEAHLVARLEHPHIVPLYDYWRDDEGAFLVMRFIRGGTLRDALNGAMLPHEVVVRVIGQVALGLAAAHRQNVIHRDIKPDNILLDEDGNAYLTDFGIAKVSGLGQSADEGIAGSLHYVSPEQIAGQQVTPQTDVYGLGIVLYEMLAGKHPYGDASASELVFKHLREPLPRLSDLPDAVNEVIQKATRKNASARYASAPELAQALQTALLGAEHTNSAAGLNDAPLVTRRTISLNTPLNIPPADDATQLGASTVDADN